MFVFCALLLVAGVVCQEEPGERCQPYPDNHCMLQGKAIELCPHQTRWMYDWDNRTCIQVYWGEACGLPDEGYNMFTSERQCFFDCAGES